MLRIRVGRMKQPCEHKREIMLAAELKRGLYEEQGFVCGLFF